MRILLISKYAGLGDSPAPTRQFFLAKALAEQSCDVMLVGSRSNGQQEPPFRGLRRRASTGRLTSVQMNGPIVDLGLNARRLLSWFWFEIAVCLCFNSWRRFKPDVVMVSSLSFLTILTGLILKWALRSTFVVEVRDVYPLTLVEVAGFSPNHPVVIAVGWIERLAYRHADLLVSPLENCGVHACKVAGRPVPFVWLPMGYDREMAAPDLPPTNEAAEQAMRAIDAIKAAGKFVVLYAGTMGTANALAPVFAAAELLESSIQFVFLGDGPLRDDFRRRYSDRINVTFIDRVPKLDTVLLLRRGDLLLNLWLDLPIYRLGVSPNKWIDYSLAARPFLTNVPEQLVIVHETPNAIVIDDVRPEPLAAAIKSIAEWTPARRDAVGEAGRAALLSNRSYDILSGRLLEALQTASAIKDRRAPMRA